MGVDVVAAVRRVAVIDPVGPDLQGLRDALADIAGLRRWLDGRELMCHSGLQALAARTPSLLPEATAAQATGTSLRDAGKAAERVATTDQVPELGDALRAGRVSGAHVDAVTSGLRSLEPAERRALAEQGDRLVLLAESMPADDFRRQVAKAARQIRVDGGMSRAERQQRDVRCRTWVDHQTGMVHLTGRFDPLTGASLASRLDRRLEALFHDATPDLCPTDPLEKQGFLRGRALLDLLAIDPDGTLRVVGAAGATQPTPTELPVAAQPAAGAEPAGVRQLGGPCGCGGWGKLDMTLVIDARTYLDGLHPGSRLGVGIPGVELPVETIRRMAYFADITAVLLDEDGVVLKHGRTRRLATDAQRRALRAMYRHCAIPGCRVPVAKTTPHHTLEWTGDHGPTDIECLIPVCKHHHSRIHAEGWRLSLSPDRRLTITFPDGSTMSTGPPREQWE
jgi:hypothetical protein